MDQHITVIITGIIVGTIGRWYLLRADYRQYPSYPQGYIVHISLGFIASALGAIAVPAIMEKEYTAVTFLALAAQHFREIRNMERENLMELEKMELVKRGTAYIEDISKVFESRNYISIFSSLLTCIILLATNSIILGIIAGTFSIVLFKKISARNTIDKIAKIRLANLKFDGPLLCVENIVLMNIGLSEARNNILKNGIGIMLEPKNNNAVLTLENIGQRQAIIHDVVALLGTRKDVGEPEYTPLARRDPDNGNIGIAFVVLEPDAKFLIEIVRNVPVLESCIKKPLKSKFGLKAAD